MKSFINTVALLGSVLILGALPFVTAHAQFDPESGDTGQWQPPPPAQPQPPPQQAQPQPPPQQAQPNAWQQQNQQPAWVGGEPERPPAMGGEQPGAAPAGNSDHAAMVGHMGVTFFGVQTIQVGVVESATAGSAVLRAPTIGIRRWLSDSIGLDVGLGLAIGNFSTSKATAGDSVVLAGMDSVFALGLHAGLPVALSHSGHFAALLIPEVDFGYGSAKLIVAPANPDQDITLTGVDFRLGVRVGGEIHFGFWDLPQLSLQGTVGLGIRYQSGDANDNIDLDTGGISETGSSFEVTSFVNDIMNGTIRINYYF